MALIIWGLFVLDLNFFFKSTCNQREKCFAISRKWAQKRCRKVLHDYFVEKGGFRKSVRGEIVRVQIEEFTCSMEITFFRSIRGCSSQILSSSCIFIALRLGILGTSSHQIWKLFGCSVHSLFVRYSILFAPLKVFLIISVHHICDSDGSFLDIWRFNLKE